MTITIQVVPIAQSQLVTIPLIEPDSISHTIIITMPTFDATVDYVGDDTVAWDSTSWPISSRWCPFAYDDIVAWWLVALWGHPKPYGCLKWYHCVCGYTIWIVYQVHSDCFTRCSIVVIADKVKRSTLNVSKSIKVYIHQQKKKMHQSMCIVIYEDIQSSKFYWN